MDKPLYERANYLINAKFIKSTTIMNYDIAKANISILRAANLITEDEYLKLANFPKEDRERSVGLMIRENPDITKIIKNGIIDLKRKLFVENNIVDDEVIRIANDAVYVMRGVPLRHTDFGDHLKFIHKNTYSLFARVGTLTFLFGSNLGDIDLDVLGLGSQQMLLHADYMLSFIGNLFYMMEFNTVSETMAYFNDFYQKYINRTLPVQYYRELNPNSLYCVRASRSGIVYGATECSDPRCLEIGYNAQILRELYGFITEIHDMKR